ncbi:TIPIN-like protein [Ooceraea biroi]|uniref:TIMELESS-interacting protein n=1 Tax=Ooceraea biroi TaxID=2015173 RepID=A0A026W847_OOCBI|nr:TIPIN-like protein [Ooceraea biroi]
MANTLDYEGDDNIIAHYENEESDGERRSLGEAEEATSDNETGTARRIDPSTATRTHVIRNPAPKLNTERLKGPNGIQIIEKYFEAFKFYGKGHEKTDLDRIMKRLEHWSYRLFPKYHFDDFLARAEQLGAKKDLQVFMKKYRLDMINSENDVIINDDMDDDEDQQESAPIDDFDLLITEQIQKQKQAEAILSTPVASTSNEDAFDILLAQSDNVPSSQIVCPSSTKTQVSDDMKKKIKRNKQLAIQRRLERQKEREEEIKRRKLLENTNMDIPNENDNSTAHGGTDASQVDDTHSQIDETTSKIV